MGCSGVYLACTVQSVFALGVDCTSAGAHLTLALAPHPRMRALIGADTEGDVVQFSLFWCLVSLWPGPLFEVAPAPARLVTRRAESVDFQLVEE